MQTAANEYFNKDVSQLTLWECASIASITKNPTNYNPYPDYRFLCTLSASRRRIKGLPNYQLHTVSAACGYLLERHHHALADAEACAEIALRLFG